MSQGTIVQCIGAVVDIQFPRDSMPKVYDALKLEDVADSFAEANLTFEVQQQLGDGVVRTIAMGSSDGLRRGMKVANTGKQISVPVGMGTLGRIKLQLGRLDLFLDLGRPLQRSLFGLPDFVQVVELALLRGDVGFHLGKALA